MSRRNYSRSEKSLKRIRSFLLMTVLLTAIDQLSKAAAVQWLRYHTIVLIPGVFELHYLQNEGAAFGILRGRQWLLSLFALIICAAAAILYPRIKKGRRYLPVRIVCILMASGALGNMIDRLARNYVVDFLYFSLIDFPIFNIADVYVCAGCALLIFCVLFIYREEDELLEKAGQE